MLYILIKVHKKVIKNQFPSIWVHSTQHSFNINGRLWDLDQLKMEHLH